MHNARLNPPSFLPTLIHLFFFVAQNHLCLFLFSKIILLPQLIVFVGLIVLALVIVKIWRRILRGHDGDKVGEAAARQRLSTPSDRTQQRHLDRVRARGREREISSNRRVRLHDEEEDERIQERNSYLRSRLRARERSELITRASLGTIDTPPPDFFLSEIESPGESLFQYLLDLVTTSSTSATSTEQTDLTSLFETFLRHININQSATVLTNRATDFLFRPLAQVLVDREIDISTIRVGRNTLVHDRYLLFGLPYSQLTVDQKRSEIIGELARLFHIRIVERVLVTTDDSERSARDRGRDSEREDNSSFLPDPPAAIDRSFFDELEARAIVRAQRSQQLRALLSVRTEDQEQDQEQGRGLLEGRIGETQSQLRAELLSLEQTPAERQRRAQARPRTIAQFELEGQLAHIRRAQRISLQSRQDQARILAQQSQSQSQPPAPPSPPQTTQPAPSLPLPIASSIIPPGSAVIGPNTILGPNTFLGSIRSNRPQQELTITSSIDSNNLFVSSPSSSSSPSPMLEIPNIVTPSPRKEYTKEQWEGRLSETSISKSDLNYMILNYLVVEGYQSAALKFAQEADLSSANQNMINGTIKDRMIIKSLIHSGRIQDAIEKINDTDPELLDTNTALHFALLRLQLIELIRHSYKSKDGENIQPALDFAASHLAQRAPSNPEFLQDLEKTMALLCFPPESLIPQLKELMDIKLRIKIAEDVNNVLLERQGMGGDSKIKSLVKLWGWASDGLNDRKVDIPPLTKGDLF